MPEFRGRRPSSEGSCPRKVGIHRAKASVPLPPVRGPSCAGEQHPTPLQVRSEVLSSGTRPPTSSSRLLTVLITLPASFLSLSRPRRPWKAESTKNASPFDPPLWGLTWVFASLPPPCLLKVSTDTPFFFLFNFVNGHKNPVHGALTLQV